MIAKITISNFQSHKVTQIKLSSGVNAIIGSSDSGKSSIVRALRWLVFNRPSGNSFKRWGTENTSVIVDNGLRIARSKSKSDNLYCLEEHDYKAFGQNVPEEITKALNLSEVNIQSQLDPPFLLSQSPGEVARYLNKVVNLDKIDSSLLSANQRVKACQQNLSKTEDKIDELEAEIDDLDWIELADEDLQELEALSNQISSMEKAKEAIDSLLGSCIKVEDEILVFKKRVECENLVNSLISKQQSIDSQETEYHSLVDLISHIQGEELFIKEYESILSAKDDVDKLLKLEAVVDSDIEYHTDLSAIVLSIKSAMDIATNFQILQTSLIDEFNKMMPDICPLCGQEVQT